jgi:hypothetical protein
MCHVCPFYTEPDCSVQITLVLDLYPSASTEYLQNWVIVTDL